jgi:hypothetical protein
MADVTQSLPWLTQWLQGGAQGQRAAGAQTSQPAQGLSQTTQPGTNVTFADPNAAPAGPDGGLGFSQQTGHTLNGVSIAPTTRPGLTANFLQHQDPLGLSDKILGNNGPSAWVRKLL